MTIIILITWRIIVLLKLSFFTSKLIICFANTYLIGILFIIILILILLIVILIIIILITLNVKQFVSVIIFIKEKLILCQLLTLLLLLLLIFLIIQRNLVFVYFALCFWGFIGRIIERRTATWAALVIINEDYLLLSWIIIYSIFLSIFIIFKIAIILTLNIIICIFIITSFRMLLFLLFQQFTF